MRISDPTFDIQPWRRVNLRLNFAAEHSAGPCWWCMAVVFVRLGGGWGRLWGRRWVGRRPHSPQRAHCSAHLFLQYAILFCTNLLLYPATSILWIWSNAKIDLVHEEHKPTMIFWTTLLCCQTTRLQSVAEWSWKTATRAAASRQEI